MRLRDGASGGGHRRVLLLLVMGGGRLVGAVQYGRSSGGHSGSKGERGWRSLGVEVRGMQRLRHGRRCRHRHGRCVSVRGVAGRKGRVVGGASRRRTARCTHRRVVLLP